MFPRSGYVQHPPQQLIDSRAGCGRTPRSSRLSICLLQVLVKHALQQSSFYWHILLESPILCQRLKSNSRGVTIWLTWMRIQLNRLRATAGQH